MPTLTAIGAGHGFTAGDLDTDGYVAMVPAFQTVFFADGRPYDADITASGYHKLDFSNTKLTGTVTGAGWTAGEVVTQAVSGAQGIYIESVSTAHFVYRTGTTEFDTTNVVTGADSTETTTPSAVTAPPHWLNWTLTDGDFPDGGSNIMTLAFGRIFMNSMSNPNQWFATRAGDPLDIEVSQSDVGSAVSSQTSKAGLVGDEITALIGYKDYYLIFGCTNEVWVLRSDPMSSGILSRVSKTTGIFSSTAFCWDDKENFYFLGSDGIYRLSAEALVNAQAPVNITKQHIPRLVRDMALNRRTDRVAMAYDKDRYGIMLSVTQMDGGWSTIFWIDLRTSDEDGNVKAAVFPETYQEDHLPASLFYFNARRKDERLLLAGGQDGYIRKFDDDTYSDDGDNAIDSWAFIGPVVDPEKARGKVKLSNLSVTTGTDTTNLDVSIFSAETAEELVNNIIAGASPAIARTFTGDNLLATMNQKIENGAVAIRLGNDTAAKGWSMEKIIANIKPSGRIN